MFANNSLPATKKAPARQRLIAGAVFLIPFLLTVFIPVTASGELPASHISPAGGKSVVYSDLIIMKNGSSMQGIIKEEKSDSYVVTLPLGIVALSKSEIKEIKHLSADEACLDMGNRYLASRNFDRAREEYNKALSINPDFKPARDALAGLVQKQIEYSNKQKNIREGLAKEEVKQNVAIERPTRPAAKRYTIGIYLMFVSKTMSHENTFFDFGFSVTDDLIVNGFAIPDNNCPKVEKMLVLHNPATDAGLKVGDKLVSINGKSTSGMNSTEASKLIVKSRYIKLVVERLGMGALCR